MVLELDSASRSLSVIDDDIESSERLPDFLDDIADEGIVVIVCIDIGLQGKDFDSVLFL